MSGADNHFQMYQMGAGGGWQSRVKVHSDRGNIEPIYDHYLKCMKRHDKNDVTVANVAVGLEEGETTISVSYTHLTLPTSDLV